MAADGLNFTCTRCHTTEKHSIAGRCYKSTELTDRRNLLDYDQIKRITCYACHSETPHEPGAKPNDHTDKVACQTCHIPAFARKNSTKVYWDWSQAGKRDENGKPIVKKKDGRPVYHGKKGTFKWERNVTPEYSWYNGKLNYLTLEDTIDPSKPVRINYTTGSYDDPNARIYPFKVHRGRQPYDKGNNKFVVPHLFGKDDSAYWKNYDWAKAIQAGMDYVGMPFSGEVDFVDTEYLFQTTHMVAPKEKALSCTECHSKKGRLEKLEGFYMPGRDANPALNLIGWGAIVAAFLGVLIHGGLRLVGRKK
jgi:octaheme c-type cytochrome (tetrathionate reductase family)